MLLVLASTAVLAVGMSPARVEYPFQEQKEITAEYTIINSAPAGARFALYTCGTFYDQIKISSVSSQVFSELDCTAAQKKVITQLEKGEVDLDQAGIFLNPGEEKRIIAKIKLPSAAGLSPGIVETKIGVVDLPLIFKPGETVAGGIEAVEAEFWIRVPHAGKKLVVNPIVEDVAWGKKAKITAVIANEGSGNVNNARLTVDILDSQDVRKDSIVFEAKGIPAGERVFYATLWDSKQVKPGTYTVLYTISFDGQSQTEEAQLKIGGLEVVIESVEAEPVVKGGIAKFVIRLESKWGEPVPNVFADVLVKDKTGVETASVKTRSLDMKPFGTNVVEAFWETGNAALGKYDFIATVHYANKTSQESGEIEVRETAGQPAPVEYVWLAVIVILFISAVWFLRDKIQA